MILEFESGPTMEKTEHMLENDKKIRDGFPTFTNGPTENPTQNCSAMQLVIKDNEKTFKPLGQLIRQLYIVCYLLLLEWPVY